MNDLETVLSEVGLSEKESSVYLALLQLGRSSVTPISARSGVKRTSIYNFIDRLVALGLVEKTEERGRTLFHALPPSRLLELQRQRLRELEQALPRFLSLYNVSDHKPRISYFEGPEEMKNIVREEPRCTREALYVWPGEDVMEMIGGAAFMTEIDRARVAAGVWIRTVRFRDKDIPYPTSAHGEKFKRELRFAPPSVRVSMGMGVYDTGKVGFFTSRRESFGILIESHELSKMMRVFFELLWERALPARAGEG